MRDDRLQAWYRARPDRPAGGEHPSPEAIARLVDRSGPEPERLATLDHVTQCAGCGADFELLRALAVAEGPRRAGVAFRGLALAAAVVLAVAGTWWWGRRPAEPDVIRGGAAGVALVVPADSTYSLGASPVVFGWRPVARAARYRFELVTEAGVVALAIEGTDTAVAADPATLSPGRYHWLVEAVPAGGEPVRGSGTVTIVGR